jgi:hypothetical protein
MWRADLRSSSVENNQFLQDMQSTIKLLQNPTAPKGKKPQIVAWLDGFVDEIHYLVKKRKSASNYIRMESLQDLADFCSASKEKSGNLELVTQKIKYGGNAPIFAGAIANFGYPTKLVGLLGVKGELHPVFRDLRKLCELYSIGPPGHTHALEFNDGKLMLGKHIPLHEITWKTIEETIGRDTLIDLLQTCDYFHQANWAMFSSMNEIWDHLLTDVFPNIKHKKRYMFIDLADPQKRPKSHLRVALKHIEKFQNYFHVNLGLNVSEATQVAKLLHEHQNGTDPKAMKEISNQIQVDLEIDAVTIHAIKFAVITMKNHPSIAIPGPYIPTPKITTGGGDHFNAGFAHGTLINGSGVQRLIIAVVTSGIYVRTGNSPKIEDVKNFLSHWYSTWKTK